MSRKLSLSFFGILPLWSFLFSATHLSGQSTNIFVLPVPEWVLPCEWSVPTNRTTDQKSEGYHYLLYEQQENPQRKESFVRIILLMENETGVQDSGSLTFGFDPGFQELFLNRVRIHRQGKVLERLDRSKVRAIQQEPELDEHVLTGKQKALLFVEDLRVGDALEYAYTIRGANPILEGHFAMRFIVQSSVPTDRQRFRVLWSSATPIYLRKHLTDIDPQKKSSNGVTDYIWDFARLEGIPYEDDLPASYEPYPYIELSDFRDWSRVVAWALPLYSASSAVMPAELQDLLAKWQNEGKSDEERARLALNFVQDELRYTALELGPDSYRPAKPIETFGLRYGDCKAKAYLFCSLLREMKLESYPALVNTVARENVSRRLPSPFAFNHVIVKLLLEGTALWVDPTRSQQGGLLRDRYLPPLGKALVVKPGVTTLEDIPPSISPALERVTSTFKLTGYDAPAVLTVHTTHRGREADNMRAYFARNDTKEISKEYLNFYSRYYPGISEIKPFELKDQRLLNVLEVSEHYQVRDLWKKNKSSQKFEAEFYGDSIERMLTDPDIRLRKMPLRLSFPLRREHEIVVGLPDPEWSIPSSDKTIEGEAFSFHYHRRFSGSTVRFQYDCETKTAAVPAEKVPDYLKLLDEMQDLLGDSLERPDDRPGAVLANLNWLMIVIAGFASAAALAGGVWVWRTSRQTDAALVPPLPDDSHLQGLGGWLILVGFGLCLALVARPISFARYWEGFFSNAAWQLVAMPGGEQYHPLYAPLLVFEVMGNIFLIGLNILALCLFFGKRKVFPRTYITFLIATASIILIDQIVSSRIPYLVEASRSHTSFRQVSRAIVQAILWSSYMIKSRRVKATFVR